MNRGLGIPTGQAHAVGAAVGLSGNRSRSGGQHVAGISALSSPLSAGDSLASIAFAIAVGHSMVASGTRATIPVQDYEYG